MDQRLLYEAIQELRRQKQQIDQVILMLETLGVDPPRRGRPPKILAQALAVIEGSAPAKPTANRTRK